LKVKKIAPQPFLSLRPFNDEDMPFLFAAYASAREGEKALFGWPDAQWNAFLHMQFGLQHTQYMRNYNNPSFDIIVCNSESAGRLYVDRTHSEIRVIDIVVMPAFRRQGIAAHFLAELIHESEASGVALSLHVEHDNPIMGYYRRLGFEFRADREVYQFMVREPAASIELQENT